MTGRAVVINGGSSSGKSTIARALQDLLAEPWLTFGVDDFVAALPRRMAEGGDGIEIKDDGTVDVGAGFLEQERLWRLGIGAMVRAGARVIIDDVFLGGPRSQDRWRAVLTDLEVCWVGVRCDPAVAEARERARGDRVGGMARQQALRVHEGVEYDVELDSTRISTAAAAEAIRRAIG